jgi:hypothetical protein
MKKEEKPKFEQLDIFANPVFYGDSYDPLFDKERLTGQIKKIYELMRDGKWRTLSEIEEAIHAPQASISAGLRLFRRKEYGSHEVNRRARGDRSRGLFEYQVVLPKKEKQ